MTEEAAYNPFDPDFLANPYPHFIPLLKGPPQRWNIGFNAYLAARYQDVVAVTRNHSAFSSVMPPWPGVLESDPFGGAPTMVFSDPPVHTRLRRLVARDFGPKRIAEMAPRIRKITRRCLDESSNGSRIEAMDALANRLPVEIIAEMLGIPPEYQSRFREWSDAAIASGNTMPGQLIDPEITSKVQALRGYLASEIERRRARPGADLIGALVAAHDTAEALSDDELLAFCVLLLIAGNETTTNLIGNGLLALAHFPEQFARMRADRSLIPSAVEEMLRYDSPVQSLVRFATKDTEVGGTAIEKGAMVQVMFAAANRDPLQFPEPKRFDVSRAPNDHVAFGEGIHFCLGAPLARLEAKIAFEEIADRFSAIALADPNAKLGYRGSFVTRGLRELPLIVESAPR